MTTTTILEDAAVAANDAAQLLDLIHALERANLIGRIDFEERMGIAADMGDILDRLNAYRVRVLG